MHQNQPLPVCILAVCLLRWSLRRNCAPQFSQWNGFLLTCVVMCLDSADRDRNVVSHKSHWCWRPNVCRLVCSRCCCSDGKVFPHIGHRWACPRCIWTCCFMVSRRAKRHPQCSQQYGFSPVWTRMCSTSLNELLSIFPQTWQINGGPPPVGR